ncbi:MAG TPA: sugar phosphate isomerase/epimerase family protein [Bdellovibrionota bacterium]|jgi:sugar phosphate isomerase/epimerase|nr:sugar phosphate isomerase/epimerase family protein [Bdellovibrionota bacterium]
MQKIKGPGIFIAQFIGDKSPYDNLKNIAKWAAGYGYKALQLPTLDARFLDLAKAAESQTYADEVRGTLAEYGLQVSELSTHLQGQLVAVHPSYDELFDGFAPANVRGNPKARTEWATAQMKLAAKASQRLGLKAHASFSGALLWPTFYPWPQRPAGLVEEGFAELARRWKPILNAFDECGVDVCYEIHPGEDLHDGLTFERFLEATGNHPRVKMLYDPSHLILQQLDYLGYIDVYHEYIKAFHVKDAEFRPSARSGVYGGYESWVNRAGRFRSPGDGQVDFKSIFSKLTQYGYDGWAVLEWECCLKDSEQGAKEGAPYIESQLIDVAKKAFDDFVGVATDSERNRRILGL